MQSILQYRHIHRTVRSKYQTHPRLAIPGDAIESDRSSKQSEHEDKPEQASSTRDSSLSAPPHTQQSTESERNTYNVEVTASTSGDLEKALDTDKPPYIVVDFDDASDPLNPHNWPYSHKWVVTGTVSITSFIVTGASAIDSEITPQVMQEFGVGQEIALLGTALFMIAFGLGSLVSAPFSEILGRNPVYITSKSQRIPQCFCCVLD